LSSRSPDRAAGLRDRLAELELEAATLEGELAAFHAEYLRRVGTVMAQVQELEARILAVAARRSGSPEDARAAAAASARAQRTTAEAQAVPSAPSAPAPSADLKTLFRDAAKRMHPDLQADGAGRAHAEAFMKRLNQAYRAGDAAAIADLLRQWGAGTGGGADRESAGLAAAVARAEQRLAELRTSPLGEMLERVMAAAARGEDLLAAMRADAEAALRDARARWETMQA
jgi:hypothetical protein